MNTANEFDVFVAYNSQDVSEVRMLIEDLKRQELKPWFDLEQVLAGQSFQDEIQAVIPKIGSAVICIGSAGLGKWQVEEVRAFTYQCVNRSIPVIPVLLRGVEEFPERLIFLRERNFVLLSDDQAINRIIQGITHQKSVDIQQPNTEKRLEDLYAEKKITERKIYMLSQEIENLEAFLLDGSDPRQETVLTWLKDRSHLAQTFGKKALRDFKDLSEEIKNSGEAERKKNQFYWELESYLELIYYAIVAGSKDMLMNPKIFPSLSDPDRYENASSDLYRQALDRIKKEIPSSLAVEIKQTVEDYFEDMKSSLPLDD
jgi:TIR domain/Phycobilisome protein